MDAKFVFTPERTPLKALETMEELRDCFGLREISKAEALIKAWPIKEAFHYYLNRCLSAERIVSEKLPEWKEVDEYLLEKKMTPLKTRGEKSTQRLVEEACSSSPFEPMPHVALFVLRAESFLQTGEGGVFDIASKKYDNREHREFDRRQRSMDLLSFLVRRYRPTPG